MKGAKLSEQRGTALKLPLIGRPITSSDADGNRGASKGPKTLCLKH